EGELRTSSEHEYFTKVNDIQGTTTHVLRVIGSQLEDEGIYTCASSDFRDSVFVNITHPQEEVTAFTASYARDGFPLTINCTVRNVQFDPRFYLNGAQIHADT
ncbi:unnamed protein product, partial [Meganyctiphanes norvegica]